MVYLLSGGGHPLITSLPLAPHSICPHLPLVWAISDSDIFLDGMWPPSGVCILGSSQVPGLGRMLYKSHPTPSRPGVPLHEYSMSWAGHRLSQGRYCLSACCIAGTVPGSKNSVVNVIVPALKGLIT